ncbi:hypothetical protein WICPIJ_004339 [Wickerhamomyces pijperi]|uniref:Zn(2)-C6 fungal-type domain-containing protein n=1 Tax=Wickerhamomyces pijperi TaxID=599730 RepID=A0A9P8Q8B5_WICPI|nr:hypothetical protein WICPIJ_004339 [Wickerhamomyces pijperi]
MSTVADSLKPNQGNNTQCSEDHITDIDTIGPVTATLTPDKEVQESINLDRNLLRTNQLNSLVLSLEQEYAVGVLSGTSSSTSLQLVSLSSSGPTTTPSASYLPPLLDTAPGPMRSNKDINVSAYRILEKFNTVNDPRIIKDMSWMKAGAPSNTPVLSPDRKKERLREMAKTDLVKKGARKHKNSNSDIVKSSNGDTLPEDGMERNPQSKLVAGLPTIPSGSIFDSSPNKKTQLSLNDLVNAVNAHASIDETASSSPLAKQTDPTYPSPFQHYNSTFSNYTTAENMFSSRNLNTNSSFLHGNSNDSYYVNNYDILDSAFKNKLDQNLNSTFNKPNLNLTAPSSSNTANGSTSKLLIPTAPISTLQNTFDRSITSSPLPKFETDFPDPKPIIDIFQTSSVSLSDNEDSGDNPVHRRSKSLSENPNCHQGPKPFKLRPKLINPANNLPKLSELIPKDEFPTYRASLLDNIARENVIVETSNSKVSENSKTAEVHKESDVEGEFDVGSNSVSEIESTSRFDNWKLDHEICDIHEENTDEDNVVMEGLSGESRRTSLEDENTDIDNMIKKSILSGPKVSTKRGRPKKAEKEDQDEMTGDVENTNDCHADDIKETKKKKRRRPSNSSVSKPLIPSEKSKPAKNNTLISDDLVKKKDSMSHPTRKKNAPPVNPPNKPTLEKINGKLVKVRIDKNKKKVLVQPRSKNGCWTCRIRKKKCSEEKPHCFQCLKLDLECDGYELEKPTFMMNHELQKEKLNHIKIHTSQRKKLGLIKYEDLVKSGKIIPANNVKIDGEEIDSE